MWSSREAIFIVAADRAQARAARAARHFRRPQLERGVVEHAVDVLVAVGAAEGLGQLHRLVDRHLVGHVDAVLELVGADQQHAVLDRRQLARLAVDVARRAPRRVRRPRAMQPCSSASKCCAVAALSKPSCSRMWASIDASSARPTEPFVQALQRELARAAARRLGPRAARGLRCGESLTARPSGWPSRRPRARRRGPCPRRAPRPAPRSRR